MSISPNQRIGIRFTVQPKTVFSFKLHTPDTNATTISVNNAAGFILHIDVQLIEIRTIGRPKMRTVNLHTRGHFCRMLIAHGQSFLCWKHKPVITVIQFIADFSTEELSRSITYMHIQIYQSRLPRHFIIRNKQPAACYFIFIIGVGNKYAVVSYHPTVTIDPAKVSKIQCFLRLTGRIGRIVTIISPHRDHIIFTKVQGRRYINNNRQKASEMLFQQFTVNPYFWFPHYSFKMKKQLFVLPGFIRCEMFPVPYFALVINTPASLNRKIFYPIR